MNGFVAEKQELWTEFIKSVATFKTFNKATLDKLKDNLSIHYFLKGETVF